MLTGGGRADVFIFVLNDGGDRITDFQLGIDTLKFYGIDGQSGIKFSAGEDGTSAGTSGSGAILVQNVTIAELSTFEGFEFV